MVTATPKKGRSKVVNKTAVEQISSLLDQLPKKEKQELPLGEAIAEMSETIQAALAKGYSFDELSKMLSEKLGVSVSVWSLRRYLNAALQGAAAGKPAIKSKRGRKAKATPLAAVSETVTQADAAQPETSAKVEPDAPVVAADSTPEPAAPEASAPTKKRRTRSSADAAAPAKPRSTRTKSAAAAKADGGAKTTTRKARSTTPKAKTGAPRGRKKADQ